MCQTNQHQWCQPRSSGTLQNVKDFLATKSNQVRGIQQKGYLHWRSSQEFSVLLFNGISFAEAQMFWKLKLYCYKYCCSAHLCDKQLSKPSASAANLCKTLSEIDPHRSEWLSLKRVLKKIDVRFLVSLIINSGLQHLKVDFASGCCHSEWSQNILL